MSIPVDEYVSGNGFKSISDEWADDTKPNFDLRSKPRILFLKTDWIEQFKHKVLPLIDYDFVLVTHNADRSAPCGNYDLLDNPRLLAWYAMNLDAAHHKLHSIPIGVANEQWEHGNKHLLWQASERRASKQRLLYCNFDVHTNAKDRVPIMDIIKSKRIACIASGKLNFAEYVDVLSSYKYTISPPGNSVDCHRIWESIYLGVIPVVRHHPALKYFSDLPILFVNSFEEITEDMLESRYEEISTKSKEKATMSFYFNLITSHINRT